MSANQFRFTTTEDGSPTLEIVRPDGVVEKMHSHKGAFSETLHVYGQALDVTLSRRFPPHFFVLGLGLGYIEIMIAAAYEAGGESDQDFLLWSTESEDLLVEQMALWLEEDPDVDPEFARTYDWILEKMSSAEGVSPDQVKTRLATWKQRGLWQWYGAFDSHFDFQGQKFSGIFFDAFSNKINPDLWEESLLNHVLQNAHEECVLSTYASKTVLKRVLGQQGFELLPIAGYGGKRECTIAVRPPLTS